METIAKAHVTGLCYLGNSRFRFENWLDWLSGRELEFLRESLKSCELVRSDKFSIGVRSSPLDRKMLAAVANVAKASAIIDEWSVVWAWGMFDVKAAIEACSSILSV